MECNKDEAFRAKEIAERKVTEKDYTGAKKFSLKVQNLYPWLDSIAHVLTTLDVYIYAEKKVSGEADWYGVFTVNPSADDAVVRKQYRKLAMIRHPDKNKSVGADGAFKHEVILKYDMEEVLDDYNEEQGVSVIPLIKVAGFRTVFQKHMDPKEVRRIPKKKMFCFSHQVPNYWLTGQEAHNAPMGCRELDPAATSLELFQVANEALVDDDSRKTEKELLKSAREGEADRLCKRR